MGSAKIPKIDIRDLYGFLALESTQRKGRERMLAWHQHVSLCAPGKMIWDDFFLNRRCRGKKCLVGNGNQGTRIGRTV